MAFLQISCWYVKLPTKLANRIPKFKLKNVTLELYSLREVLKVKGGLDGVVGDPAENMQRRGRTKVFTSTNDTRSLSHTEISSENKTFPLSPTRTSFPSW